MARDYIARDPKTGRPINRRSAVKQVDIRSMLPPSGVWERIPRRDIVPLASGQVKMVEIPRSEGGGLARRIDGILALNRVLPAMVTDAHTALCEALDDDEGVIRLAGLKAMPSFAIKKHEDLFMYLSDRLLEENEHVRKAARECLRKVAPIFPSGCEEILRRELRHETKQHRDDAFATLKDTSQNWAETGCLHIDELIREEDVDLRRRGAKILRTITAKGGATGWDLISWSLQDEDAQVRRSASACLPRLANVESRVATIFVEASMFDEDSGVKKNIIRTLKTLDMENPRVAQLIQDGARDRDPVLRKACIEQLSIILTGDKLREVAAELLRQETRPELRTKLERLSRDVDWEGTEDEKNRALAPLDKVPEEFSEMQLPEIDGLKPIPEELSEKEGVSTTDNAVPPRSGEVEAIREGHKEELGRRAARKQDERDF
tara:strand:+ start:9076 stop:10380 length:1305 start_codon:yes stop_codon:yes gene_type:complete